MRNGQSLNNAYVVLARVDEGGTLIIVKCNTLTIDTTNPQLLIIKMTDSVEWMGALEPIHWSDRERQVPPDKRTAYGTYLPTDGMPYQAIDTTNNTRFISITDVFCRREAFSRNITRKSRDVGFIFEKYDDLKAHLEGIMLRRIGVLPRDILRVLAEIQRNIKPF